MNNKLACPVCESSSIEIFLSRENVPVHQNLLLNSFEDAINAKSDSLELCLCLSCSFVFNNKFDISKLEYGDSYDNTQTFSPFFNDYVDNLVNYIIHEQNTKNSNIVEVGCGKGGFIKKIIADFTANNIGYGFDPTYMGDLIEFDGKLKFKKSYFDANSSSDIKVDVVICRHVIEHVPRPFEFLLSIKEALNSNTKVYFETPCVNWILENKVAFDFFYEHCSYFNIFSFEALFQRAGFTVDNIKKIFGDQYLWLEATSKKTELKKNRANTKHILHLAKEFSLSEKSFISYWKDTLSTMSKSGNIAIWGAGAKGVTFANLIDPQRDFISCFIDLNPNKQDCYIPLTGHVITSYKKSLDYNIKNALVMNENYMQENLLLLEKENLNIRLHKV